MCNYKSNAIIHRYFIFFKGESFIAYPFYFLRRTLRRSSRRWALLYMDCRRRLSPLPVKISWTPSVQIDRSSRSVLFDHCRQPTSSDTFVLLDFHAHASSEANISDDLETILVAHHCLHLSRPLKGIMTIRLAPFYSPSERLLPRVYFNSKINKERCMSWREMLIIYRK